MVRAKFRCSAKTERENAGTTTFSLDFYPVIGNSEENKKFFTATPGGKLELAVVNHEAAKIFEAGKEYYIDFTPVIEKIVENPNCDMPCCEKTQV
jgi:hypothetical protein